ncbi:hypothetical protein [Maricaulis sp. MIT060901]|uniref:hypothetical protein n=1 Tax=Maricaulis sp. MIT060901 TaxID=3096993 RepID=UPI00399967CB
MPLNRGGIIPVLLATGLVACGLDSDVQAQDELIPRAALFSDNTRYDAALSADGRRYAWSAEHQGVPAIWMASRDGNRGARPVTPAGASVPQFIWSANPDVILIIGDNSGDERWRVSAQRRSGRSDAG